VFAGTGLSTGEQWLTASLEPAPGAEGDPTVIMSLLLLVPINNRNKSWTPDNRPADWKQQLHRWGRYHYVRVAVIIAAFTLLVAALA
jgi:uncharacterized membrane protein